MSLKEKCPVLQFADLGDERGRLVVIEGTQAIPFEIKRVFYIYGSDSTVVRGQHANRKSEFVLINVAGTSKVRITDGSEELVVELNKPMMGVYIPKMIWKDMYDFSSDSVLLVLASTHYDGQEYIRNYQEYMEEQSRKRPLVSLGLPTNGIVEWVFPVLDSIYAQGVDNSLFEVVLTDNGQNREFKEKIRAYTALHENLIYAETNAEPFLNEIEAYKRSKGELIKFVNHRTKLVGGALNRLIEIAKSTVGHKPVIYFSNGSLPLPESQNEFKSFDQFVKGLSYLSSWSTGMAIWKEDFDKLPEDINDFNELFPHTTVLFYERDRERYIIDNTVIFDEIPHGNKPKGDYDLFYAFGVEYPGIISSLYRDGDITASTCKVVLDENLNFVADLYYSYILRKRYCSYSLGGLHDMYGIYYTRGSIRKGIIRKINKKLRHIVLRKRRI